MPSPEICYQLNHPEKQTPCFKEAGSLPCSNDDCPVYDAIRDSDFIHSLPITERESYIECNLLHFTCRMSRDSKDNAEFLKRLVK